MRHQQSAHGRSLHSMRFQLLAVGLCTLAMIALWPSGPAKGRSTLLPATAGDAGSRVMVELFVMSMCPDAKFCENALAPVLKKLQSIALVRTEYIAKLGADNSSVSCMHGSRECQGNLMQLCLKEYIPDDKNIDWFYTTLQCHTAGDVSSKDHLKQCMSKSNVTNEVQNMVLACADGEEGKQLQVTSAQEVADRQVKKSCTIYMAGQRRCIRDGGRWYDCPGGDSEAAFTSTICNAYSSQTGKTAPQCVTAATTAASSETTKQ